MNENKYFKMSVRISQDLDFVTSGLITLDILDTNNGGNLIVELNDEVIYDKSTPSGRIKIPVNKRLLKSYNVLEISTTSPSWQFWRTNFYKIDTVEFSINLYGGEEHVEQFKVTDEEIRYFESAKLKFEVEDYTGDGNLIIKINDHIIFDGQPHRIFSQEFDAYDVGLVKDGNALAFSTTTGSSYNLKDVEITITHEL
jgi:hypothetical protein